MNAAEKRNLIWAIIAHLEHAAMNQKKAFDKGDTFFSLAFKSDADLQHIAKLSGV